MKFERLQADIQNYASEDTLSIYTVLGVLLDAITDVEKDGRQKVKNCETGNEELAGRIVQLCRFIQGIYDVHKDELLEDQERLERFTGKIGSVEASLAETEKLIKEMQEQKKDYEAKSKALDAKQKEYRECAQECGRRKKEAAELEKQCAELEKQIAEAKQFDPRQAKVRLADLQKQKSALEKERDDLVQTLSKLEEAMTQAKEYKHTLETKVSEGLTSCEALSREIKEQKEKIPGLQAEITARKTEKDALQCELEKLAEEKANAEFEKEQLSKSCEAFRINEVEKARQELENVKAQIKKKQDEKGEYEEEAQRLLKANEELVLELTKSKSAQMLAQKKQEELAQQFEDCEGKRKTLEASETELTDRIHQISSDIDRLLEKQKELEEKTIPEAEKKCLEIKCRVEELEEKMRDLTKKTEALLLDREAGEKKLKEKETQFAELDKDYSVLTEKLAAHSSDIHELQQKLNALRKETSETQLATVKEQHLQAIRRLEKMAEDCKAEESQLAEKKKLIDALEIQRDKLESDNREMEEIASSLQNSLQAFAPFASSAFEADLRNRRNHLRTLNEIKGKMEKDIRLLHSAIGRTSIEDLSLSSQVQYVLREIDGVIAELETDLKNCAGTIKMEEC